MANHAHSTRAPLLRQSTGGAGLLAPGLPTGRIIAPGGPVTRAIAVMRAADLDHPGVRSFRQKLAERIEADLELLDALDGDPDLEIENEHGGDIQDEPHDEDTDVELSLCGLDFGYGSPQDLELDDSDKEPSLGAIEMSHTAGVELHGRFTHGGPDQSRWGSTGTDDREDGDDNGLADWRSLSEQGFGRYDGSRQ